MCPDFLFNFCQTSFYLSNFSELSAIRRAQKRLFCSKSSARTTTNTEHTMHHHHGGCCELQRWLAISWCHNESNNKQRVRIERHVTAASMICDTTAKILLSAVEISLDLRTKRSFYLLRTQHHEALIDQPADHTNIESQNSQTTSSFPYVATAVPTICNSLLATNKSCDLNRSAAVRKHASLCVRPCHTSSFCGNKT